MSSQASPRIRAFFSICVVVAVVLLCTIFFISTSPKMSSNPRIKLLQTEAIELEIFERTLEIRENAKDLFGLSARANCQDGTANNVTFRGCNGQYDIVYQDLVIKWIDLNTMTVLFNGTKVYRARMGHAFLFPGVRVKEITSFIKGPWLDVFDEMVLQAMKGLPKVDMDAENWGIE